MCVSSIGLVSYSVMVLIRVAGSHVYDESVCLLLLVMFPKQKTKLYS